MLHVACVQMDAVDSTEGLVLPVSVWSYKLNNVPATPDSQQAYQASPADAAAATASISRQRRIVVLEPVNTVTAHAVFDARVSYCTAVVLKYYNTVETHVLETASDISALSLTHTCNG